VEKLTLTTPSQGRTIGSWFDWAGRSVSSVLTSTFKHCNSISRKFSKSDSLESVEFKDPADAVSGADLVQ